MTGRGDSRRMTDGPGILFVPEIHPFNVWLWRLVSWVRPVRAARVQDACRGVIGSRIQLLDIDEYLDADTAHCFRAEVLRRWEALVERILARNWRFMYDRHVIDWTAKACQDLAKQFELGTLLARACERSGPGCEVIDSAVSAYLRRCGGDPDRFANARSAAMLSQLNRLCDFAWLLLVSAREVVGVAGALLVSLVRRNQANRPLPASIHAVWDGVNPNEITCSPEQRCFFWIADAHHIAADEVLYIAPIEMDSGILRVLRDGPHQVVRGLAELYPNIPRRILWSCLADVGRILPRLFRQALMSFEGLLKAGFLSRAIAMTPLVRHVRPGCYVTSMSALGNESPAVAYLNALGIPTVLYCYSANTHLFGSERCRCDFRAVIYSHISCRVVIVWHRAVQHFFESHPQDGSTFRVIGPLMAGDEAALRTDRFQLLQRYKGRVAEDVRHLVWICAFDEAGATKAYRQAHGVYPDPYTEAYSEAFLRDMVRLLEEFEQIRVIFKPQRSLRKPKFAFSSTFRELIEFLQRHPRGLVLPDDLNPWIPIALADVCIAMPFASPVQVGWHYGTPGLYHDPTNACRRHRYGSVEHLITHSYEEFKSKVAALLTGQTSAFWENGPTDPLSEFVGLQQGGNSSELFRVFLRDLSEGRTGQPSIEPTLKGVWS